MIQWDGLTYIQRVSVPLGPNCFPFFIMIGGFFGTKTNIHLNFTTQSNEMRPYGLRRCIRCPKKYGEAIKVRTSTLAPSRDLDFACEQSEHPQRPLDDRYIRNAAVLPDLRLPSCNGALSAEEKTPNNMPASHPEPLMIHGFMIPEYQQIYHSVVDPLLFSPCGALTAYSLQLGCDIKDHLFEELAYPTLQISEQPNGRVEVTHPLH
uniref:Uncharacterized protein n=1 Tax=Echeneis naucrates TaxID=173247 RepID=A0A665UQN5_ECHNA